MIYKIAVMSDVHANLPALTRVLEDIKKEKCDRVYHIGDAIGIGAFPKETLDVMLKENIIMIMGNHEYYYLTKGFQFPKGTTKGEVDHHKWVRKELGIKYQEAVSKFPVLENDKLVGLNLGFIHYVVDPEGKEPLSFKDVKEDLTETNIDAFFQLEGYDIIFFGHQHHPLLECRGKETGTRYVNPSALGCQRGSFANYSILEINETGFNIRHKEVTYEKDKAVKALDLRKVPAKEYIKKIFYGRT
ncbi:metallophosphoesterase family protein [Isachenkonia alkalipeptolytica]|uniref:Metallophosphoesterase family protein n=1 Tax=Isachenkonia alkalipeptolytica TaxID=2565777 RepID=A0AA43XK38_9CLOT|nr:metallophosphoesterase family protein [Isachenkonia alkalipeptolytica]NBG88187.1 metallophosphoesterase family protein [Isachenkonia alkalipeptolytica]